MDLETRLALLAGLNALAFVAFIWDKAMSKWKRRRLRESTLLLLTLLGGEVGSVCGMLVARHKTRKRSFLWKFWLCFSAGLAGSAFFLIL